MAKQRKKILLVDGYNVLRSGSRYQEAFAHPDYTDDAFNTARERLINDVINFAGREYKAVIVFDGGDNQFSTGEVETIGGVRIMFSPAGQSADKVIDGNIEEALNLICMEIHGKNSVRTRGSYNVRNEFCGDRISRLCFSVLTSITEIRHNRRYSSRRRSSRRVDHDEKFHEVIVNGR